MRREKKFAGIGYMEKQARVLIVGIVLKYV